LTLGIIGGLLIFGGFSFAFIALFGLLGDALADNNEPPVLFYAVLLVVGFVISVLGAGVLE
jgi:hypothetical protein